MTALLADSSKRCGGESVASLSAVTWMEGGKVGHTDGGAIAWGVVASLWQVSAQLLGWREGKLTAQMAGHAAGTKKLFKVNRSLIWTNPVCNLA